MFKRLWTWAAKHIRAILGASVFGIIFGWAQHYSGEFFRSFVYDQILRFAGAILEQRKAAMIAAVASNISSIITAVIVAAVALWLFTRKEKERKADDERTSSSPVAQEINWRARVPLFSGAASIFVIAAICGVGLVYPLRPPHFRRAAEIIDVHPVAPATVPPAVTAPKPAQLPSSAKAPEPTPMPRAAAQEIPSRVSDGAPNPTYLKLLFGPEDTEQPKEIDSGNVEWKAVPKTGYARKYPLGSTVLGQDRDAWDCSTLTPFADKCFSEYKYLDLALSFRSRIRFKHLRITGIQGEGLPEWKEVIITESDAIIRFDRFPYDELILVEAIN